MSSSDERNVYDKTFNLQLGASFVKIAELLMVCSGTFIQSPAAYLLFGKLYSITHLANLLKKQQSYKIIQPIC